MGCHWVIVFFFVSPPCLMEHGYRYHNGLQASPFCEGGVSDSPAKPKCGVTCTKTYSDMVFYSSNLSLPGARSLHYLEALAKGVIPYPGSPQVITGKKKKERHRRPYPRRGEIHVSLAARYRITIPLTGVINRRIIETGRPKNISSKQPNTAPMRQSTNRSPATPSITLY